MIEDTTEDWQSDAHAEALTALLRALLNALDALQQTARQLHPPQLEQLVARVTGLDQPLREAMAGFQALQWPDHLSGFSTCLAEAAEMTGRGLAGLQAAAEDPEGIVAAYRALRHIPRALEALYPLAQVLPPISRFYLEDGASADDERLRALAIADGGRDNVGVMHANNERGERGGFSLYVPEDYDPARAYPVVMAMHGGNGHGRAFLWSWLKEARSRQLIVVSPTAKGVTWSLMPPDVDSKNVEAMLGYVRQHWNVDERHMLLTGMSDGGTFCYVSGLRRASPFTHLAPVSASFHPFLLEILEDVQVAGRRIRLTHGRLDWMFAIDMARMARTTLEAAGALVDYREVPDLSHTYPRDENGPIVDWFLGETSGSP